MQYNPTISSGAPYREFLGHHFPGRMLLVFKYLIPYKKYIFQYILLASVCIVKMYNYVPLTQIKSFYKTMCERILRLPSKYNRKNVRIIGRISELDVLRSPTPTKGMLLVVLLISQEVLLLHAKQLFVNDYIKYLSF